MTRLGGFTLREQAQSEGLNSIPPHVAKSRRLASLIGDVSFESAFQPIIGIDNGQIAGFEALLRPRDAQNVPLPPSRLFAAAEKLDVTAEFDLECQRRHLTCFESQGGAGRWLFLNVDVPTLIDPEFTSKGLPKLLDEYALDVADIVVEVLETPTCAIESLIKAIRELRAAGARIALDDFGTGNSNLSRVMRLAPDFIKIDRGLIHEASLQRHAEHAHIIRDMVHTMRNAGAAVIIEGIENAEALRIAKAAQADYVQGYFIGHPRKTIAEAEYHCLGVCCNDTELDRKQLHAGG